MAEWKIGGYCGGFVQTNGYFLQGEDGTIILIDAPLGITDFLKEQGLKPSHLLLTHQHYDHVEDVAKLKEAGVKVYAWSPYSRTLTLEEPVRSWGLPIRVTPYEVDQLLEGMERLEVGGLTFELAHVPGHSTDSVIYHLPDQGVVFAGDTLFAGSIGRTDLPGGNHAQLIAGIQEHLLTQPPATTLLPGHGPATTVSEEMRDNPYIR